MQNNILKLQQENWILIKTVLGYTKKKIGILIIQLILLKSLVYEKMQVLFFHSRPI